MADIDMKCLCTLFNVNTITTAYDRAEWKWNYHHHHNDHHNLFVKYTSTRSWKCGTYSNQIAIINIYITTKKKRVKDYCTCIFSWRLDLCREREKKKNTKQYIHFCCDENVAKNPPHQMISEWYFGTFSIVVAAPTTANATNSTRT